MTDAAGPLLTVEHVSLTFGGVHALSDVSLALGPREILAVIGPNGAGKTSLLNSISGFYRPQRGRIVFDGRDITRLRAHRRAELGIARTFQQIELYSGLTALENLLAGRHVHVRYPALLGAAWFGPARAEEVEHRRVVEEIIDLLEIRHIRHTPVGILPYGLRKRVELGRALAMEPKLLLLDEPVAGMNIEEKEDMIRFVLDVHDLKRIPMILVEHDIGIVGDIAERVVVLDFGQMLAEGAPDQVRSDPAVVRAYLGQEASAGAR
jgi:branched-chain amino acid transport system ATP-binding protein